MTLTSSITERRGQEPKLYNKVTGRCSRFIAFNISHRERQSEHPNRDNHQGRSTQGTGGNRQGGGIHPKIAKSAQSDQSQGNKGTAIPNSWISPRHNVDRDMITNENIFITENQETNENSGIVYRIQGGTRNQHTFGTHFLPFQMHPWECKPTSWTFRTQN